MLPGKTYKPEEFLQILRKRIWVIIVPFALISAGTAVVARLLPDLYRSRALIQYVPPRVPVEIAGRSSTATLQERLRSMEAVILSRTRLEQLVQEFNLYEEERKTRVIEDVMTSMRNDIKMLPGKGDIFSVEYQGRHPLTVMRVTGKLANYFIEESLKDAQRRADNTADFVDGTVEEKERELKEIEDQLRKYKMQYSGELPEQRAANLQTVGGLQNQLQQLSMALQQDKARQLQIERLIADLESQTAPETTAPIPAAADPGSLVGNSQQRLSQAKAQLDALIARGIRSTHPEYAKWQRAVKQYEKEINDRALTAPVGSAVVVSPAEQNRLKQLAGYRNDLEDLKQQISQKEAQDRLIRQRISEYQAKVDRAPLHEAQLTEIQREYKVKEGIHQGYVAKREQANMTVNLQRRQIGEQFVMVDEASMPQKPFSPDRLTYNVFGLLGGLAVGLGLVALLEYRDSTFKTDSELGSVLSLPVLAVVPLMLSDAERRARFRRRLILNLGLGSTVALCLAVVAYTFVTLR